MAKSSYTSAELAGLVITTCHRYYPNQNFDKLDLEAHLKLCLFDLSNYITRDSLNGFFLKNETLTEDSHASGIYVYDISTFENNILEIISGYSVGVGNFEVCNFAKVQSASLSNEMKRYAIGGIVDGKLHVYFGESTPGVTTLLYVKRPTITAGVIDVPDLFAHILILLASESTLVADGKEVPAGLTAQIKERMELLK